ncbi:MULTISPECIES: orotidine-5'-phosphate decarboxylase [Pontibacillus]|uniref:Orotidine 5'-phosphate decarboxylase n=1 Tax=Pontibacillus chungwhensis TaxID=265426 RepID=A0ABY8V2N9_9BACI|nr:MULTISPECIES: orotidine-5'-phosphate decarboxylase [Pontibacillus]MCD5322620.1 orotidine-5'-phosphate decarboxylase [Pontibacillus sp. HN14]WIF99903.1 orotidine-5'-phosphate decarboxylase [Pontibacillus chungwhensis]
MKPLYLALDFPSGGQALSFIKEQGLEGVPVKVGMELFYKEGAEIVRVLKEQGHAIFLDLKLHDIPNTVQSAMKNLASLGVDVVNVHAAGGSEMIQAAKKGLLEGTRIGETPPLLLAVTQLTSTTESMLHEELGISLTLEETVVNYAKMAHRSGADGVVCSAHEVSAIRQALPDSFYLLCPGIRLKAGPHHDQKRVVTPSRARELGVDSIVVGRGITKADKPVEMYRLFSEEWTYVK